MPCHIVISWRFFSRQLLHFFPEWHWFLVYLWSAVLQGLGKLSLMKLPPLHFFSTFLSIHSFYCLSQNNRITKFFCSPLPSENSILKSFFIFKSMQNKAAKTLHDKKELEGQIKFLRLSNKTEFWRPFGLGPHFMN